MVAKVQVYTLQRLHAVGRERISLAGRLVHQQPHAPHLAPLVVDLEVVVTATLTAVLDGMTRP